MKTYTLQQYIEMAERFNKLSFSNKIKTVRDNEDILTLASDGNWWGVKVKDREIQEQLHDQEVGFVVTNEWGSSEMHNLINLLGIDVIDI